MTTGQHLSLQTAAGRVLLYATDPGARDNLCRTIASFGIHVEGLDDFDRLLQIAGEERIDVCLIDDSHVLDADAASQLRASNSDVRCIVLTDPNELPARDVIPTVACEYLEKPVSPQRLKSVIVSALAQAKLVAENRGLKARLTQHVSFGLVGLSPAMGELREQVRDVAADDRPVFVCGEQGTEITAVARAVHSSSRRAHRPFARIDCSLLTSDNLERELGETVNDEDRDASGRLNWATGGTLLLDNIVSASLRLHESLLNVVAASAQQAGQDRKGNAFGVRLVAAAYLETGGPDHASRMRARLFELLGDASIVIPPLCERREDIGLLAEARLEQLATFSGRPAKRLSLDALRLLQQHDWPGNLAELNSVLQQASLCNDEPRITADTIRPWLAAEALVESDGQPWLSLKDMERRLIETTFVRCGGNRERTARALKIGLRTLSGKLREYGYPPRGGPGSNRPDSQQRAA